MMVRMESISIKYGYGVAKIVGSATSLIGALVYAFVKGPPIQFINWNHTTTPQHCSSCHHRVDWIKGSIIMLSANTVWSFWLILQVLFYMFPFSYFIFLLFM